ncbi:MarR family transcriptional regulator [Myxococcus sp. CA051A]|uniref:MarR family winged helix-turn-helix transcriptional regulator n=1 Tax=Myxococcus TaxID=32 RepID=UPI00157B623B|nr:MULTISPECIES: MarR family transcriptional regulator [Myxococcus]NTX01711.1 MarR family transcriptional regulator [Myxococcus sp. CA040A]NTX16350.1 MarR family transcriptional regulator [Myxococcus sp. CA056]NTX40558.1 MarR family transcriptional regulator [Myxococcus sp. CA033]NTX50880.1 MarR family transcriptional regulator [Myxococcus sp. CA039A]NTX62900.1 MarR family transcriptional regulator [Myxococcus sp. CA051A]
MAKIDAARIWSLNHRLLMAVISSVASDITALGLETKELFVLAEVDAHPYPAELAASLCIPKPSVTLYVKRLEAAGFLRREIDTEDLRRHRLQLTPAGRKVMQQGTALLSEAFGEKLGRLSAAQQAELRALLEKMS